MNMWAILFFMLIIVALGLYIVLQRRDPETADVIAEKADSWWKRLLGKLWRK